jgi:hypothetical protein
VWQQESRGIATILRLSAIMRSMALSEIQELRRLPSPAPKPQALAFDGTSLWMGSRETHRLYAIDPHQWTARDEAQAPGVPYGLTVTGDELRVLCGEGPDDNRRIRRFIPGHGFHDDGVIEAPDDTGSYLAYDGDALYMAQWYRKKILGLTDTGAIATTVDVSHGICGLVIVNARFYCVTTDDEETNEYWLTRVDARHGKTESTDIARIPFAARSLAFDGINFWTNHREQNEIVTFAPPAAL